LYFVQGYLGICMAFAVPAWYSIFTRHVDKWEISFEWSLQSVFAVGLATAVASAAGGYAVEALGFQALFAIAGTIGFLSSFLLFSQYEFTDSLFLKCLYALVINLKSSAQIPIQISC